MAMQAPATELASRLNACTGHCMPATLLENQLDAMQSPVSEGDVAAVDAVGSIADVLARAIAVLDGAGR